MSSVSKCRRLPQLKHKSRSLAICAVMFIAICSHCAHADGLTWTAHDPHYVAIGNGSVHFSARDPKLGKDWTTAPINLEPNRPWAVDFTVQMQPAPGAGMCVKLIHGHNAVCWMGAGDYYKYISGFLSSDATNMPYDSPWDNSLHAFKYVSDGKRLSLWHNGQKFGDVALTDTPDMLYLESTVRDPRANTRGTGSFKLKTKPVPISVADIHAQFRAKDAQIAILEQQNTDLENQVNDLQNSVAYLKNQATRHTSSLVNQGSSAFPAATSEASGSTEDRINGLLSYWRKTDAMGTSTYTIENVKTSTSLLWPYYVYIDWGFTPVGTTDTIWTSALIGVNLTTGKSMMLKNSADDGPITPD